MHEFLNDNMSFPEEYIFADIESGNASQSLWIQKSISNFSNIKLKGDDRVWSIKKVYEGTEKDINSINNRAFLIKHYRSFKTNKGIPYDEYYFD